MKHGVDIYVGGKLAAQMNVTHDTLIVDLLGSVYSHFQGDDDTVAYACNLQVYDEMVVVSDSTVPRYARVAVRIPVLLPHDITLISLSNVKIRDLRAPIRDKSARNGSTIVPRDRIALTLTEIQSLGSYMMT